MNKSFDISKYFTLGRGLDTTYQSNKFALIITGITFLVYFFYAAFLVNSSLVHVENFRLAIDAALLSFFTWAVGREFDPDDHLTAMVSQLIASIVIIFLPREADILILPILLVIVATRLVNRVSGKEAVLGDFLVIAGLGIGYSLLTQNWIYALIATFAFVFDSLFRNDAKLNYIFAVLTALASIGLMYYEGVFRYVIYLPPLVEYFFLLTLLITLVVRFFVRREIDSNCDMGSPLKRNRVLLGSLLIVLSFLAITFYTGEFGYATAIPLWSITLIYPIIGLFNRE